MKHLSALLLGFFLALIAPSMASASADCEFRLGFKALRDLIPDVVGECLENEHYNTIGDSVQQTTGGLLVWRKADNWTAFTDGYRTWINGPNGLEQRLNTERFPWEPDYAPGGGIATPEPGPAATPVPAATPAPAPLPTPMQTPTPTPLPPPPRSLGLDPFYEKYLDAGGIPIVGSAKVPNQAFYRVKSLIDEMLAARSDIRSALAGADVRVAIMSEGSVITDLPEFSDLYEAFPGTDWDERTRGGGLGPTRQRPVTAIAEENLLCYEHDVFPKEDIFVHEFAHAVHTMGILSLSDGARFQRRLEAAYRDALGNGLWKGMYAAENDREYWAEGVQSWFGLNDPPGPIHNHVDTRTELEAYDPTLAEIIRGALGDGTVKSSCHENADTRQEFITIRGAVVGPGGNPLQGIGLWAWQGSRDNSGYGKTDQDGAFDILVPDGSFTLDVYAGPGCSFVGWFDGAGITAEHGQAARVTVSGASVSGIVIRLPSEPDDLPRIEWCAET